MSLAVNAEWDNAQYIDKIPYVHRLPFSVLKFFPHLGQLNRLLDVYYKFIGENVKKHQETYKPGAHLSSFINI